MKLKPADQDRLDNEPWLRPFIEDGDVMLGQAQKRFQDATRAASAEVRIQHRELFARMLTASGLETTALQTTSKDPQT